MTMESSPDSPETHAPVTDPETSQTDDRRKTTISLIFTENLTETDGFKTIWSLWANGLRESVH